ncbi:MAG: hypothetical protein OEZ34_07015, partial [Spirochaetia bacterium]|nr:hypothetical protein [Spirochaetia bacterium]
PSPVSGHSEWIRICSPNGLSLSEIQNGLYLKDSSSQDKIVPYLQRFVSIPANVTLTGNTLELMPKTCAILVDPDFDFSYQILPLKAEDRELWTVETSSAMGNGISSGEGLILFTKENDLTESPLCSFGLPDTPLPFFLQVQTGETIERKSDTIRDSESNYNVRML